MHPERPFLVGLACWTLIIANVVRLYLTMKQLGNPTFFPQFQGYPYPPSVAEGILFFTMAVCIVCGICLYEGVGWMRFIYIPVLLPYFVQGYLNPVHIGHARLILGAKFVLYLASIVVLFLPKAQFFFNPPHYVSPKANHPPPKHGKYIVEPKEDEF